MHRSLETGKRVFHLPQLSLHAIHGCAELPYNRFPFLIRPLGDVDSQVLQRHGKPYLFVQIRYISSGFA